MFMKKKKRTALLWIILITFLLILSNCSFIEYHDSKTIDPFSKALNATYHTVKFTFYSDETDRIGLFMIAFGRSVVADLNGLKLLSVRHTLTEPDIRHGFRKTAEKCFISTGPEDARLMTDRVLTYFFNHQLRPFPGVSLKFKTWADSGGFGKYVLFKSVFTKCWENNDYTDIAVELKNIEHAKTGKILDSIYVPLDDSLRDRLHYLIKTDFDLSFDWRQGQTVGLLGAPYNESVSYRSGSVLSKDWVMQDGTVNTNYAVIDIMTLNGDSGGVVFSIDSNKIIGLVSKRNLKNSQGVILKIWPFLHSLELNPY
jgi:hypothetical protein